MFGDGNLDGVVIGLVTLLIIVLVNGVVDYIINLNCKCDKFKLVDENEYYTIDLKKTTIFKLECVCCGRIKFKEVKSWVN